MDKPTQAKFPVKVPKGMSKTLDPPTMKKANDESKNKPVTNESLVAESAFAVDSGFVARNREIEFHPFIAGWTQVVDDAYAELRNDSKVQVSKKLPIEAFRYYAASTFWLRAISLKLWQGQDLTPAEVDLQRTFEGKTLVLPDAIHLGLKSVGRVTTKNGEVLAPTFPPTPSAVVDRIPGLIAVVDEDNHNVYPVVGIAYQGCHQRAQTVQAHTYVSAVAPQGTVANRNLQGYDTLKPVRQDCTAVLHDMGFGDGALPRTIANTGINYNALKVVSNILARTVTFKLAEVDVFTDTPHWVSSTNHRDHSNTGDGRRRDARIERGRNRSVLRERNDNTDRYNRSVWPERMESHIIRTPIGIMEFYHMDASSPASRTIRRIAERVA